MRLLVIATVGLLAAACNSPTGLGVDLALYEPIPPLHAHDYATVAPAEAWDYWELRFSMGFGARDSIVGRAGPVPRESLPAPVQEQLEGVRPQVGFAIGCLPALCFHYIATVRGEQVSVIDNRDAVRAFLGDLESVAEAALLVRAMGYYWYHDIEEATGYREQPGGGWSFVVLQLVGVCVPVQTDRVLLQVARNGTVTERRREVWEKNEHACI